jgi:guanylate kinase
MFNPEEIIPLLQHFTTEERESLHHDMERYDTLLHSLQKNPKRASDDPGLRGGILALNGASGSGQSYVLERVEKLLAEKAVVLPRIYLLATRAPRPGEGYQAPYIFVRETSDGFQDIFHPEVVFQSTDIYYFYQSRPGASNAILLEDVRAAMEQKMYLETVIPTLLRIKTERIKGIPAWGENLRIAYLATPGGHEWAYRLLNREPEKLESAAYRASILGRVASSLSDMQQAAQFRVPTVLNWHGQGEQAAREILEIWGI